jgi:hypothetical protein
MMISPINELDPHFHKPWGLLLILWDKQQRDLFGLTDVIDAFEQIMQDPTEMRNLSPYMADMFGNLAILTKALHEIEIYQPWAATFEDENRVSNVSKANISYWSSDVFDRYLKNQRASA